MDYKDLLKTYITNSGLSLRRISEICTKEKNVSLANSYLSRILSGKVPPPSDEISKAIAEVTGGDPEELIWLGYLTKAPREFQETLKQFGDFKTIVWIANKIGADTSDKKKFFLRLFHDWKSTHHRQIRNEKKDKDLTITYETPGKYKFNDGIICKEQNTEIKVVRSPEKIRKMIDLFDILDDNDQNELILLAEFKSSNKNKQLNEYIDSYLEPEMKERA